MFESSAAAQKPCHPHGRYVFGMLWKIVCTANWDTLFCVMHTNVGRAAEAVTYMRRALRINPQNKDYYWELARTVSSQQNTLCVHVYVYVYMYVFLPCKIQTYLVVLFVFFNQDNIYIYTYIHTYIHTYKYTCIHTKRHISLPYSCVYISSVFQCSRIGSLQNNWNGQEEGLVLSLLDGMTRTLRTGLGCSISMYAFIHVCMYACMYACVYRFGLLFEVYFKCRSHEMFLWVWVSCVCRAAAAF